MSKHVAAMSPEIVSVDVPGDEEWMDVWRKCSWATFFESPQWSHLWQQTAGVSGSVSPLAFLFSDGVKAILPGTMGRRLLGMITVLESSPGGTYGGPLATDEFGGEHLLVLLRKLADIRPDHYFRYNPYLLKKTDPAENPDFTASGDPDFTQSVFLDTDEEQLISRLKKKRVPQYADRASNEGFSIRKAGVDDLDAFLSVYHKAQSRWARVAITYSGTFLSDLISCDMVDFWGCYGSDDRLAGGGLVVLSRNCAVSWLPVFHPDALKHHITELFYFELIRHYREMGYTWFDLNPSGGNDGVVRFKNKLGPERLPSPVIRSRSVLSGMVERIRNPWKNL